MNPAYFDPDRDLAYYRDQTPNNLNTGGKQIERVAVKYGLRPKGKYKKKQASTPRHDAQLVNIK